MAGSDFKMENRALEVYRAGQPVTDAWHKRMREDQRVIALKKGEADDHKRGATSPLGGDGWWKDPRISSS